MTQPSDRKVTGASPPPSTASSPALDTTCPGSRAVPGWTSRHNSPPPSAPSSRGIGATTPHTLAEADQLEQLTAEAYGGASARQRVRADPSPVGARGRPHRHCAGPGRGPGGAASTRGRPVAGMCRSSARTSPVRPSSTTSSTSCGCSAPRSCWREGTRVFEVPGRTDPRVGDGRSDTRRRTRTWGGSIARGGRQIRATRPEREHDRTGTDDGPPPSRGRAIVMRDDQR